MGSIQRSEEASMPRIIDIRRDVEGIELKNLIKDGLKYTDGEGKTLPTLLLYDNKGLKLFEAITYLDEYYLTEDEIAVLKQYATRIADRIPQDAMLVELGSGNLRKVKILLDALERACKNVNYYALDLMYSELERTLEAVPKGSFKHVQCYGLWGTYDDGLEWLKTPENAAKPKTILSMGSSIGNFTREEAVDFIAQFAEILKPADTFIVGLDACQDPDQVYHAYNDRDDVTHNFTMNGLHHANTLLEHEAFVINDWEAVGEYDQEGERHRAFVVPKRDLQVLGTSVRQGERIRIEESYKYNHRQASQLFNRAGVIEGASWAFAANEKRTYALHMLYRPATMFSTTPESYAKHPVPSLREWDGLWALWDQVTRQMIPDDELFDKPIQLRNACIFYLGHIPTFFDMKLTEATGSPLTEPKYFTQIFERGIDPDVDDPSKCHKHSEVPDTWPQLEIILKYQDAVRERVKQLYASGQAYTDNWTGRALWLGFEHEIMHLETLLYMLVQSEKTLPPAGPEGTVKPDFEQLASRARQESVPNEWFDIPEQTLTIGMDDPDNADGPVRQFGWDVEKPAYTVKVPGFRAAARPITNAEYARYVLATSKDQYPTSWVIQSKRDSAINGYANGINGHASDDADLNHFVDGKFVRTVYGLVPLKFALDWPVSASYDELVGCATFMGGRIPTMEETRSIYEYAALLKERETGKNLGKTIPAVNSHLVNDGVEETPPSSRSVNGTGDVKVPDPKKLYVDLEEANVGFKHWHPVPVTPKGGQLAGQGDIGGLWEWTSSVLEKREGFEPMKLYPAYSADFYDDKHNIVLGGSWATHPRFAGRKTVINWYQRNYPFVWAGARLVKDH